MLRTCINNENFKPYFHLLKDKDGKRTIEDIQVHVESKYLCKKRIDDVRHLTKMDLPYVAFSL